MAAAPEATMPTDAISGGGLGVRPRARICAWPGFLLACNTVHSAAREVEDAVDLPFLHIVDPTAEKALAQGIPRSGCRSRPATTSHDRQPKLASVVNPGGPSAEPFPRVLLP